MLCYGPPASGQHFTHCLSAASNATVLVPVDVSADLGAGASLAPDDEIALFTDDGVCAGVGRWQNENLSISIAGTNSQESEGYEPEEPLNFKVWDASANATYSADVTYRSCEPDEDLCRDNGLYATDAVYELASLAAADVPDMADLHLTSLRDSIHVAADERVTFRFLLTNDGPDDAAGIEVATSVPSGLTIDATTTSRGEFDASTGTWSLAGLAAEATDTLAVTASAEQTGTYAFTAEVRASSLPDPDSTPDNDADDEDDQRRVTLVVSEAVSCAASTLDYETIDRTSGRPGTITITVANPDGLLEVNFVDADGQPALRNLTAAASHDAFTSSDGVHWQHTGGAEAPEKVAFTLTQDDPGTPDARYEAEALSVCPDPDPRVTRFAPSPAFTFDGTPIEATLEGNAPNPFHQQTDIHIEISAAAKVQIQVYDVLGRRVATLVDRLLPGGSHAIPWNGRSDRGRAVSSGVYLYRLRVDGQTQTGRMNVVR